VRATGDEPGGFERVDEPGHTMTTGEEVAVVGALSAAFLAGAAWAFERQE
jgi:hypothetical protein